MCSWVFLEGGALARTPSRAGKIPHLGDPDERLVENIAWHKVAHLAVVIGTEPSLALIYLVTTVVPAATSEVHFGPEGLV